jgi:hypothetical protein
VFFLGAAHCAWSGQNRDQRHDPADGPDSGRAGRGGNVRRTGQTISGAGEIASLALVPCPLARRMPVGHVVQVTLAHLKPAVEGDLVVGLLAMKDTPPVNI